MNDQNRAEAESLPFEWWTTTFRTSIENIGSVLLILSPWTNEPIPITRAWWCLFEIFTAVSDRDVKLHVRLPPSEYGSFREALVADFNAVINTMARVQAEKAQAWQEEDRKIFFEIVENGVGFATFNEKVKDPLPLWCLNTAESMVEDMEKSREGTNLDVNMDQARLLLERALPIFRNVLGHQDSSTAQTLNNIGLVLQGNGDYNGALAKYEEALTTKNSKLGDQHSSTADTLHNIANLILCSKGDYDGTLAKYEDALAIFKTILGNQHSSAADTLHNIGTV